MSWPILALSFDAPGFHAYVQGLSWDDWQPEFITLHNTAAPTLAQRPTGFTRQHMFNLQDYYRRKGWSGGPHLFIDDHLIWVFNDLLKRGTHSPSWNGTAIGIEMLGDYERESFDQDRGLLVRANSVDAIAILSNKLGFSADSLMLHREDDATTHACPGKLVHKHEVIIDVISAMAKWAAR